MFSGSLVALVTPMNADGSLAIEALHKLIHWHIEQGTQGIVVAGTTGESPTLDFDEYRLLIQETIAQVAHRVPVIAGSGTNGTDKTISLTQAAKDLGVDACLLITPYYNKPTQAGLQAHYEKVARSVAIPQILYNNPVRTACDLLPETVGRLAKIANIIAIKEAVASDNRFGRLVEQADGQLRVFSGDDASVIDCLQAGGQGVISVTANILPQQMRAICDAGLNGQLAQAKALQETLMPCHQAMFVASNPVPVKWALAQLGFIPTGIRLPLLPLSTENQPTVHAALSALDFIGLAEASS